MSEVTAVQNPMLRYADQIGWRRVGRREALQWRGGESGLFFNDVLRQQLIALNPGVASWRWSAATSSSSAKTTN